MEHNILVIGNGFDLAHGLKTRYIDFIDYVRNKMCNDFESNNYASEIFRIVEMDKNGFIKYFLSYTEEIPGWVDMERLIKRIIDQFQILFQNYKEYLCDGYFVEKKMPSELCDVLEQFGVKKDTFQYKSLGNCFTFDEYSEIYGLNTRKIFQMLRRQLDGLIRALECYLILETGLNPIDKSKVKKQIVEINPSYVISFNYTTTYKLYGINDDDVFHVHGKIESKPNNMVLGFDDDNPENLDFVYFKKYFQRIQKLTGYIDSDRFSYTDGNGITYSNAMTVHFYGHSMDNTDGDIIRKLKKLSNGFVIYKYNQDDYEQKVINLIDVFGKEEATKLIQNGFIKFEPCSE